MEGKVFYYKCEKCQSEWTGIKQLDCCPFCNTKTTIQTSNFTKIDEALSYIFSAHGIEVVKESNRLVALLSDYAPTLERERKLIRLALSLGVYSELISVSKNDKASQELAINKAVSKLHNDAFMDPIIAKEIIYWLISCLGWSENKLILTEQKNKVNEADNDFVQLKSSQIKVGETIVFGTYPQDDLKIPTGIEWDVVFENGTHALLLSQKCLDAYPYNRVKVEETWPFSDLRKWLNNEFLNLAFNSKDQLAIINNTVPTSQNPRSKANSGAQTSDKVFILSHEEIFKYNLTKDIICQATKYAISKGVFCGSDGTDAFWWLRTPGYTNESAMYVTSNGRMDELGYAVNASNKGIRPAIWVDLNKIK